MKFDRFTLIAVIVLALPLSGCQVMIPFFVTNTLKEACTIRIRLIKPNSITYGQYESLPYGKGIIKKAGNDTFKQLTEKLKPTKINAQTVELTLPAESTVYIGSRSSVQPAHFDSLSFKTSQQEIRYNESTFSKALKRSGKLFSLTHYYLYTVR